MGLELEWKSCYWCSVQISRSHPSLPWLDDYGSLDCEQHPYAFSLKGYRSAPHQTQDEVHQIICKEYESRLLLRERKPLHAVDDNVVNIARKAQRTSREAAQNFLPKSGTIRRRVHDLVFDSGFQGKTDEELERMIGGKHQTISSTRRSLVIDGYLEDSGRTRRNSGGEKCIVWVHKDKAFSDMLFNHV